MKTKIKSVLSYFVGVIIFAACANTQKTTILPPTKEPEVLEKVPPIPWTQGIDPYIEVGDPYNFYNEFQIDVYGVIPQKTSVVKDGRVYPIDSSKTLFFPIPALTMGEIVQVIRDNTGMVVAMIVRFDLKQNESDYSEELLQTISNYEFKFSLLKRNKTFYLEGLKQILYEGDLYNIKLRIHGNGSGYCRLLYDSYPVDRTVPIVVPATGVPRAKGEKVIQK